LKTTDCDILIPNMMNKVVCQLYTSVHCVKFTCFNNKNECASNEFDKLDSKLLL